MATLPAAATAFGRCCCSLKVGRVDQPGTADLASRQDPKPDATVDRHVVDPEAVGRLVQAEMAGSVRWNQPAIVPANTGLSTADLATRPDTKYALWSNTSHVRRPSHRS